MHSSALARTRARSASNPSPSPAVDKCRDILSLPGDSDVTIQVAWLNTNDGEQHRVLGSRRMTWAGDLVESIGFLLPMRMTMTTPYPHP